MAEIKWNFIESREDMPEEAKEVLIAYEINGCQFVQQALATSNMFSVLTIEGEDLFEYEEVIAWADLPNFQKKKGD
jgi:hypothetical protein